MKNILLVILFVAIAGCSSKPKNADVQVAPPSPGYQQLSSSGFTLRPMKTVIMENGLKIIFIHDSTLPRVSLTLLVKAGVISDPSGLEGVNAMTAFLLEQGTQAKNASQVADAFADLGSDFDSTPGSDFSVFYADSLSSDKQELLNLFSDVMLNPAFSDHEITRIKSQLVSKIQKKIDNPSSFADDRIDEIVFGKHPYAYDTIGNLDTIKKIKKQDIIRHYLAYYRPNNSTMAVVGNFDAEYELAVQSAFAKWTKRNTPALNLSAMPDSSEQEIYLMTKNNLQQTQIRISKLGIKRADPDYLKAKIANEILGGGFSSRLNQHVRDDLGLTYSIYSFFDARLDVGSFDISTFTKNETAEKAVAETLQVYNQYLKEGAKESELAAAKSLLIGQFPRLIETADKTAFNILALDYYGVPVQYLTDYIKNVESVTLADVNQMIQTKMRDDHFKILVFGNTKIIPQFKNRKTIRTNLNTVSN